MPLRSNFRLLDEIRTYSSDTSYSEYCTFMTSWCLTNWVPRVWSRCLQRAIFLGFPAHVLVFYFAFFPLVPFTSYSFHFQLAFYVCLSFKFSFSVLHFLLSSSFSFLFSCSSMVDYSSIRVDCPLIAFLFARLCCLLEAIDGECLKWVSLFMGEDFPNKFVLSSLFPLVSHFAKVAGSLKMSKVRSSDLDTGLSSFDDRMIPEVTSPSTLYKAWNIPCALSGKDEKQIRDMFQFLNSFKIRIL